jgi:hypothetical protein
LCVEAGITVGQGADMLQADAAQAEGGSGSSTASMASSFTMPGPSTGGFARPRGRIQEASPSSEHAVNADARLASLHQLECDKPAAERAKLDAEKAAMEGKWQFQSSRIQLNVGGTRFETSRGTLCMVPDSMLAAMFSGRHALTADEDGSYFIDRDGKHFGHILNFLRQGTIQVELNTDTARALAIEAEFYGLADLASVLRADGLDITRYLGEEIASMRAQEMILREPLSIPKLPGRRDPSAPTNNHEGLLSVFEDEGVVEQMNDSGKDPMGFFQLLGRFGDLPASQGRTAGRNTVSDLASFRKNLRASFMGKYRGSILSNPRKDALLDKIETLLQDEPKQILMAGGAVLRALTANTASGLKWVPLEIKFAHLFWENRIDNKKLEKALKSKLLERGGFAALRDEYGHECNVPIEFTQEEFNRFRVSDLTFDHFISAIIPVVGWRDERTVIFKPVFAGADNDSRRGHLLGKASDIDLFVISQDKAQASEVAFKILRTLVGDGGEKVRVMRGPGVINVEVGDDQNGDTYDDNVEAARRGVDTVQIALRLYESPAEVLLGFDCDCCCVGYDGERVWALPRAVRAIRYGTNVLNPLHSWPCKASYEFRLVKYALRGYSIAVPGFESVDVDLAKIIGVPLSKLKGFARLLRMVMAFDDGYKEGGDMVPPKSFGCVANQMDREYFDSKVYGRRINQELGKTLQEALGDFEYYRLVASSMNYYCEIGDEGLRASMQDPMVTSLGLPVGHGLDGWGEIAEFTGTNPRVPVKLEDAWDSAKRSREYLNAKETDLDARYFAHVAREQKRTK